MIYLRVVSFRTKFCTYNTEYGKWSHRTVCTYDSTPYRSMSNTMPCPCRMALRHTTPYRIMSVPYRTASHVTPYLTIPYHVTKSHHTAPHHPYHTPPHHPYHTVPCPYHIIPYHTIHVPLSWKQQEQQARRCRGRLPWFRRRWGSSFLAPCCACLWPPTCQRCHVVIKAHGTIFRASVTTCLPRQPSTCSTYVPWNNTIKYTTSFPRMISIPYRC